MWHVQTMYNSKLYEVKVIYSLIWTPRLLSARSIFHGIFLSFPSFLVPYCTRRSRSNSKVTVATLLHPALVCQAIMWKLKAKEKRKQSDSPVNSPHRSTSPHCWYKRPAPWVQTITRSHPLLSPGHHFHEWCFWCSSGGMWVQRNPNL